MIFRNVNSQIIYYGLPNSEHKINIGDKILLNIPVHSDGKFMIVDSFDDLLGLMKSNSNYRFKIEISYFIGTPKMSLSYTESLKESLISIIKFKSTLTNYEIIAKGKSNPIFFKKDSSYYKSFNNLLTLESQHMLFPINISNNNSF